MFNNSSNWPISSVRSTLYPPFLSSDDDASPFRQRSGARDAAGPAPLYTVPQSPHCQPHPSRTQSDWVVLSRSPSPSPVTALLSGHGTFEFYPDATHWRPETPMERREVIYEATPTVLRPATVVHPQVEELTMQLTSELAEARQREAGLWNRIATLERYTSESDTVGPVRASTTGTTDVVYYSVSGSSPPTGSHTGSPSQRRTSTVAVGAPSGCRSPDPVQTRFSSQIIARSSALGQMRRSSQTVSSSSRQVGRRNEWHREQPSWPRNIHELKALFVKAQKPGNDNELRMVKRLCSSAHRVPQHERTELHRYALTKWRNPLAIRPSGEDAGLNNPQIGDPVDTWYAYYCHHRASWPRGVRSDSKGNPLMEDLELRDLVTRLRPATDGERLVHRNLFLNAVWELFYEVGLYAAILRRNNVHVAPFLTSGVVPFPAGMEISSHAIAEHFARCGVSVKFAQERLSPWARVNYGKGVLSEEGPVEPAGHPA